MEQKIQIRTISTRDTYAKQYADLHYSKFGAMTWVSPSFCPITSRWIKVVLWRTFHVFVFPFPFKRKTQQQGFHVILRVRRKDGACWVTKKINFKKGNY
jgi:hypothetical protein